MAQILIVEDDTDLAKIYTEILEDHNFTTLTVSSTQAAIAQLRQFEPDLICLDWELQNENSSLLLAHLQKLEPQHRPAVILISAHWNMLDVAPYDHLVNARLRKPSTHSELMWCIQGVMKQKENQPDSQFEVKFLNETRLQITLTGRLTASLFHELMATDTAQAHTILLNIQGLHLGDVTRMTLTENRKLNAANLKRVYLVHDEASQIESEYLQRFIPRGVSYGYYTNLAQALQDLMEGEQA